MLFRSVASAPSALVVSEWPLFLLLGTGMLVPYAGWFAFCRARGRPTAEAAVQALTVGLPNYVAAGLPIIAALYGTRGTVLIAVSIAAGTTLPSPITLLILELGTAQGDRSRGALVGRALRRALTKPIVLAPFIGLAFSLAGLHPSDLVRRSLDLLGEASGGVALFVTGLVLSAQRLRLNGHVLLALAVGLFLRPALTLAVARLASVPWDTTQVALLMNALPSGFFGILFAISYGRPSAEAGSIVLASTVASAATLAVVIAAGFPHAAP